MGNYFSELIVFLLIVSRGRPLVDDVVVVGKFRYSRFVTRKSWLIQIGSVYETTSRSLIYSSRYY